MSTGNIREAIADIEDALDAIEGYVDCDMDTAGARPNKAMHAQSLLQAALANLRQFTTTTTTEP